jgi:predicted transcriptional regulator
MRKMLLSFKADVYQKVVSGEKIYEHRKVFPDEPIEAYLYVSAPIKAIVGIMHLANKKDITDWKLEYAHDSEAVVRIDEYLKHHKYAMEILDFQNTNAIALSTLREDVPDFVVPQMYYFIDNTDLLRYLKKNLTPIGDKITHSFDSITSDQICKL